MGAKLRLTRDFVAHSIYDGVIYIESQGKDLGRNSVIEHRLC